MGVDLSFHQPSWSLSPLRAQVPPLPELTRRQKWQGTGRRGGPLGMSGLETGQERLAALDHAGALEGKCDFSPLDLGKQVIK